MHEGDELADLQTFLLSPLRATDETVFAASGRVSFVDRFAGFGGEESRYFGESELVELRRDGLTTSLDILIDALGVVCGFEERGGLFGVITEFVWFD